MTEQKIICGNNIEMLKTFPDNYFHAVVTDPPYGYFFMGAKWDYNVPSIELWKEVFRVLKPGGYVLSFSGTRTYHRMAVNIEDAGFEIRDCIQWIYGCLSEDTEILTKDGYIQYRRFINNTNFAKKEILVYDAENDIYKWEVPKRWSQYTLNKDTCYSIKSNNTDQIVSRNHRCLVEQNGKLVFKEAHELLSMEIVPTLSDDFYSLQERQSESLQSSMQRTLQRTRVENMGKESIGNIEFTSQQDTKGKQGRKKSRMEGWDNISEEEGLLCGSKIEICEMSKGVYSNVEKRRIYNRIPLDNGNGIKEVSIEDRVCSSHRPQSNEQQHKQSDAICNEQRPQIIRSGKSYNTTMATITSFEYEGIIFCPTVSTGAFVARRNGKTFITGNSGFPKSHNISKAIDKLKGAEREVTGTHKHPTLKDTTKIEEHCSPILHP